MNCITTFYNQLKTAKNEEKKEDNKEKNNKGFKMEFIDRNILVNSINGNPEGLLYLINELTNDEYNNVVFKYDEEVEKVEKEESKEDENNASTKNAKV